MRSLPDTSGFLLTGRRGHFRLSGDVLNTVCMVLYSRIILAIMIIVFSYGFSQLLPSRGA